MANRFHISCWNWERMCNLPYLGKVTQIGKVTVDESLINACLITDKVDLKTYKMHLSLEDVM